MLVESFFVGQGVSGVMLRPKAHELIQNEFGHLTCIVSFA